MTGRGRGRGRGYVLDNIGPNSVDPVAKVHGAASGDSIVNNTRNRNTSTGGRSSPVMNNIERMISQLKFSDDGPVDAKRNSPSPAVNAVVEHIKHEITESALDESDVVRIVILLQDSALDQGSCCPSVAKLCQSLQTLTVNKTQLRSEFLRRLQKLYSERADLKSSPGKTKWLNLVRLFCQLLVELKIEGQPLKPLAFAVCCCLQELLEEGSDESEIELFCEEISNVVLILHETKPESLLDVVAGARDRLISRSSTSQTRCRILRIIESNSHIWASGTTQDYYKIKLEEFITPELVQLLQKFTFL